MLDDVTLENVLFLDIETVPVSPSLSDMNDQLQKLWDKKSSHFRQENESPEDVYQRAGIYAEFGKIICISVGHIIFKDEKACFRIKSFYSHNEKELLEEFSTMLEKFSSKVNAQLCAHNGKEFDFPYIARRMLINHIKLPKLLDTAGKKPWEVKLLDTLELWKFGDYKHYTSLELLSYIFNIPSPKNDLDGSMVAQVYWQDKDFDRIVTYCENDVLAVAQLLLRYKGEKAIDKKNIEKVQ